MKSPVVSCIICHKEFPSKGLFTHVIRMHDRVNSDKKPQSEAFIKARATIAAKTRSTNLAQYHTNPKQCKCCNVILPYEKRMNNYCSHTCAAKKNNTVSNQRKSKAIANAIKQSVKRLVFKENFIGPMQQPKMKFLKRSRTCTICGTHETIPAGTFKVSTCKFCSPIITYRQLCKFTFNLKEYPDEFNLNLLSMLGMFHPTKNPQGVSRDHLVSVHYGYMNKINPQILSHPANCKIISQRDNSKKHNNCAISLVELLSRIQQWDTKYSLVVPESSEISTSSI